MTPNKIPAQEIYFDHSEPQTGDGRRETRSLEIKWGTPLTETTDRRRTNGPINSGLRVCQGRIRSCQGQGQVELVWDHSRKTVSEYHKQIPRQSDAIKVRTCLFTFQRQRNESSFSAQTGIYHLLEGVGEGLFTPQEENISETSFLLFILCVCSCILISLSSEMVSLPAPLLTTKTPSRLLQFILKLKQITSVFLQ